MYQNIDGTIGITVNDWINAGLSYKQFNHDSYRGYLHIVKRGINGNTLIDVHSIKRPDRLQAIERTYGKVAEKAAKTIFDITLDAKANVFYMNYRKPDGSPLDPERVD